MELAKEKSVVLKNNNKVQRERKQIKDGDRDFIEKEKEIYEEQTFR